MLESVRCVHIIWLLRVCVPKSACGTDTQLTAQRAEDLIRCETWQNTQHHSTQAQVLKTAGVKMVCSNIEMFISNVYKTEGSTIWPLCQNGPPHNPTLDNNILHRYCRQKQIKLWKSFQFCVHMECFFHLQKFFDYVHCCYETLHVAT